MNFLESERLIQVTRRGATWAWSHDRIRALKGHGRTQNRQRAVLRVPRRSLALRLAYRQIRRSAPPPNWHLASAVRFVLGPPRRASESTGLQCGRPPARPASCCEGPPGGAGWNSGSPSELLSSGRLQPPGPGACRRAPAAQPEVRSGPRTDAGSAYQPGCSQIASFSHPQ